MSYLKGFLPFLSPGINKTYTRHRYTKQTILSNEARQFKNDAALIIGSTAGVCNWQFNKDENFSIKIYWWGSRHDVDAHTKIMQDVLCEKLGFDDRLIKTQDVKKLPSPMGEYKEYPKGIFFELESI